MPASTDSMVSLTRTVLFLLVGAVLVGVFLEAWITAGYGNSAGALLKVARNGGYIAMGALTLGLFAVTGRLRTLTTPVDLALAVLTGAFLASSLAGESSALLTAQGIFVYLRGVLIFYAIRAIRPSWSETIRLSWLLIGLVAANVAVAIIQGVGGSQAYLAFGFDDLTWAALNRAQGLQSHPNHLGHIVGVAALVAIAAITAVQRVPRWWWLVLMALATALALSQSRESLFGIVAGVIVLALIRRTAVRRLLVAGAIVVAFVAVIGLAHPGNSSELARRLMGVFNAIEVPSGQEEGVTCDVALEDCTINGLPTREIRVLYWQQGMRLLAQQPLLGYGLGQFGGSVAYEHDPSWYRDPRFRPAGFNPYGFNANQVDSFWLHLIVETGAVGLLLYSSWYVLLGHAPARAARSSRGRLISGDRQAAGRLTINAAALAALAFGAVIALFSPSLEDPLFPPILFVLLGLAWTTRPDAELPILLDPRRLRLGRTSEVHQ